MKKIAVCHGKACGPAGADQIMKLLKKRLVGRDITIVPRDCCGRCERHNSIEVDDETIISELSPGTLDEKFLNDPQQAINRSKKQDEDALKKLDEILNDDLV